MINVCRVQLAEVFRIKCAFHDNILSTPQVPVKVLSILGMLMSGKSLNHVCSLQVRLLSLTFIIRIVQTKALCVGNIKSYIHNN